MIRAALRIARATTTGRVRFGHPAWPDGSHEFVRLSATAAEAGWAAVAFQEFRYPTAPVAVLTRASHRNRIARPVGYEGSPDATISGSCSGHAPLLLWYAIRRHGIDGLRERSEAAPELAAYTHTRLTEIGWEAHRHPHAFTVLLFTPPEPVTTKWVLASAGGWSHMALCRGRRPHPWRGQPPAQPPRRIRRRDGHATNQVRRRPGR